MKRSFFLCDFLITRLFRGKEKSSCLIRCPKQGKSEKLCCFCFALGKSCPPRLLKGCLWSDLSQSCMCFTKVSSEEHPGGRWLHSTWGLKRPALGDGLSANSLGYKHVTCNTSSMEILNHFYKVFCLSFVFWNAHTKTPEKGKSRWIFLNQMLVPELFWYSSTVVRKILMESACSFNQWACWLALSFRKCFDVGLTWKRISWSVHSAVPSFVG